MAWLLGITRREYRELEAGRLHISNELYERIIDGVWMARGSAS